MVYKSFYYKCSLKITSTKPTEYVVNQKVKHLDNVTFMEFCVGFKMSFKIYYSSTYKKKIYVSSLKIILMKHAKNTSKYIDNKKK